jgi:hypothetical protein
VKGKSSDERVQRLFAQNLSHLSCYRARGYAEFFRHAPLLSGMAGYEFFIVSDFILAVTFLLFPAFR